MVRWCLSGRVDDGYTLFPDSGNIAFPLWIGWQFSLVVLTICIMGCGRGIPEPVDEALSLITDPVDFNRDILPILADRCYPCHGPDANKREASLRLDEAAVAQAELTDNPGHYAIVPHRPGKSVMVDRMLSMDPEMVMPPVDSKLKLNDREKALLIRWIEEGANYRDHWAFISPEKPSLPQVIRQEWCRNEIDYFVIEKLEDGDFTPLDQAGKETLLRRVSLDLTGLPPSLQQYREFLQDTSMNAYEKLVDRLLASPHFGERLANDWMDVARFADTHGYSVDRYRDMSPWRDWVIDAFNRNMSYQDFVTWQLAGDLLPNATTDQILATGFNRNHSQNMEGGIVPEEFRIEYVSDRTNTFGTAFLGLTLECAKCHDHKFDPITQKEYYQLFSYFNNVNESGQISWDNATPVPTLRLPDPEIDSIIDYLNDREAELIRTINVSGPIDFSSFSGKLRAITEGDIPRGAQAHFDFEQIKNNGVVNSITGKIAARNINTVTKKTLTLEIVPGRRGKGLLLNGDDALNLPGVGAFDRHQRFTVGIWVHLPDSLSDGVIFHKGVGAVIYNFRGFHLALKDNRLEAVMAHTMPDNAIIEKAGFEVPRNEWVHLALAYDGSSKASGIKIYCNGNELNTTVIHDDLYKTILFDEDPQPGIKVGARWRGVGLKNARVDDITVYPRRLSELEIDQLARGDQLGTLLKQDFASLAEEDQRALLEYYQYGTDNHYREHISELTGIRRRKYLAQDQLQEVMVMEEMPETRFTHVLERGDYRSPGEEVTAGVPEILPALADSGSNSRLDLAHWLFQERHPLTSRVAVNRYWQMIFGKGLVETAEDFGTQGRLPTHPELLDYLAIYFEESGWDIKALLKLMVTSATYRQSSAVNVQVREKDPANTWYTRGPSGRLPAEMLRDNALFASGLMVMDIGGPSVKPYQPPGLWRMSGDRYQVDSGGKQYRRSLYTIWKRTMPHPTLSTFDVPTRVNCEVRRQKTSTPMQALVMMNDPSYIEASRALAYRVYDLPTESAISRLFLLLTGRSITAGELSILHALKENESRSFTEEPERMSGWLSKGEFRPDQKVDSVELAAMSVVASTVMNSDAFLQKH